MRTPLTRSILRWATAGIVAASCTPALGAAGDVTTFPAPSPGNAVPRDGALGPDGALWYYGWYASDPGALKSARRPLRVKRETGTGPPAFCCSRLMRVDTAGNVTTHGADPFGPRIITGLASFAGSLWVATEDVLVSGPNRMWRSSGDGFAGPYPLAYRSTSLMPGPDGNLWFAVGGGVGRMSRDGQSLTPFATMGQPFVVPGLDVAWTAPLTANLRRISPDGTQVDFPAAFTPAHVAASSDGAVWYADPTDHMIGRLVPGAAGSSVTLGAAENPDRVTVSADGVAWITDQTLNKIYRVSPSLAVQTLSVPGAASLETPAIGADGNMWVPYRSTGGEYHFARVLTGVVPLNTKAPAVTGVFKVGQGLTADSGQWQYSPTSYAYAWERCGAAAASSCVPIPGARSASYTVTATDRTSGLRVLVSAANLNGDSAPAASAIVTVGSAAAVATIGRSTRRGFVISTPVTVRGAGVIRQRGTAPRRIRACSPKPIRMASAGTRVVKCVLSPRVRSMLGRGRVTVALATTFTPRGGSPTTTTRRVVVPRTPTR